MMAYGTEPCFPTLLLLAPLTILAMRAYSSAPFTHTLWFLACTTLSAMGANACPFTPFAFRLQYLVSAKIATTAISTISFPLAMDANTTTSTCFAGIPLNAMLADLAVGFAHAVRVFASVFSIPVNTAQGVCAFDWCYLCLNNRPTLIA